MMLSILASLVVTTSAHAQDAAEVRLDAPGGSMERVPSRNQSSLQTCFAYTAAQMIDAWRFSHGDSDYNFQTSALPIAAIANDQAGKFELDEGGQITASLKVARTSGVCRQKEFFDSLDEETMVEMIGSIRSWRFASWSNLYNGKKSLQGYQEFLDGKGVEIIQKLERIIAMRAETPILPDIDVLKEIFLKVNPRKQFQAIFREICLGVNHVEFTGAKEVSVDVAASSAKTIRKKIDALLALPNTQPIGIAYCAKVNYQADYGGVLTNGVTKEDCGPHASLIIGRREVEGRPQYLVRNSWGDQCGGRTVWPCDGKGNFWIDGPTLSINIWELVYLKASKKN